MPPQAPSTPPGSKPQRGGFFRALVKHRRAVERGDETFDGTIPVPREPHPDGLNQDPAAPSYSLQQRARSGATLFLEKLTIKFLEKLWVAIKKTFMLNTNGEIDVQNFMKLSHQQMPEFTEEDDHFLEQLFDRVDRRKRGFVKTTDIATAMILICKEDPITKLRLLFRVFDADDDSCLTPDEIFDMYFSIKCNDITKDRGLIQADNAFEDELSLHEAKRLYERTVENMGTVSDFIIFEEFSRVFDKLPFLLERLLPGAFSLEWILADYRMPSLGAPALVTEIRESFIKALRRTDDSLNLSMKRGRGLRIMQNCLDLPITWTGGEAKAPGDRGGGAHSQHAGATSAQPPEARTRLPQLNSASKPTAAKPSAKTPRGGDKGAKKEVEDPKKQRGAQKAGGRQAPAATAPEKAGESSAAAPGASGGSQEEEEEDSDDDEEEEDDDDEGYGTKGASSDRAGADRRSKSAAPHGAKPGGGDRGGRIAKYSIDEVRARLDAEASDIPQIHVQTLNHKNAQLFLKMKWNPKSEQAYLRDKQDVNRTFKYQCLVCAVNHDFQLSKNAEHQHNHN